MLNVSYLGQPIGRLEERAGRVYFQYDPTWIAQGIQLSPLHLPLQTLPHRHFAKSFDGLPGLFWDSLPDAWGRTLMEERFKEKGVPPSKMTRLMQLAYVGDRGMGALSYSPAWPDNEAAPAVQATKLVVLEREARAVVAGAAERVLVHLIKAGGTLGGAFPKVAIAVNDRSPDEVLYGSQTYPAGYSQWLVKFDLKGPNSTGPLEQAYALMAKAAGIAMPPSRLFTAPDVEGNPRRHFGVQRFDRAGAERIHVHSFAGVAHKDPDLGDYRDLLLVAMKLTQDMRQVAEGVRRMVFNVAASNRDDHGKNHAFVLRDGGWSFSPAFDLVFVHPKDQGRRAMGVAGEWTQPARAHLATIAEQAGLPRREFAGIVDEVEAAVAQWPKWARQAGVADSETARVQSVVAEVREQLAAGNQARMGPSVQVKPANRKSPGISP